LEVCPGGVEQFQDCLRRSACHEAGHALLVCLVAAAAGNGSRRVLPRLVFTLGKASVGELGLPEATGENPWNDALVLLGGAAADAEAHRQRIGESDPDCVRAQRLLTAAGVGIGLTDALSLARELVAHHRRVLNKIAAALAHRGALVGSEAWAIFDEDRRDVVR